MIAVVLRVPQAVYPPGRLVHVDGPLRMTLDDTDTLPADCCGLLDNEVTR